MLSVLSSSMTVPFSLFPPLPFSGLVLAQFFIDIFLSSVHLYLFYNFTTDLVSLYWSFVVTIVTFYISKLGKNLFPILETKDKGFRNVFSWLGDCWLGHNALPWLSSYLLSPHHFISEVNFTKKKNPILLKTNSSEIWCQLRFLYFLHQQ